MATSKEGILFYIFWDKSTWKIASSRGVVLTILPEAGGTYVKDVPLTKKKCSHNERWGIGADENSTQTLLEPRLPSVLLA